MTTQSEPIVLFLSYAREDELFLRELEKHLSLLKRQGIISIWHNQQIVPGVNRDESIDEHLEHASLILLLLSPDFLASDYCYGIEMQHALERHEQKKAHVIPVFLRPCDWKSAPFAHLQGLPRDDKFITQWDNQDTAFREVVQDLRQFIEEPVALALSIPYTPIWNIPYLPNPVFTGREQLLVHLANVLGVGKAEALSPPQIQAISGLGGIGKTQLAVEYAYQHRRDYQAILWTRADTPEALIAGYMEIAQLLNLPEKHEQDTQLIVKAVQEWLKTQTRWLLIFDNVEELAQVRKFLPLPFSGHILLTTRAIAMGRLAARLEVDTMNSDVGALFLLRRASLILSDDLLEAALPLDIILARAIAEELGGLPLALDQAGAYIEETGCSLADYHHHYRKRGTTLLNQRRGLVVDHPEPITTTWSLSFEKVERRSFAAAELLRLCAFLHPDSIPEEIIVHGATHLGPVLAPLVNDPLALDEAIALLRAYGLIRRDSMAKVLRVHRLVQAVLQDTMDGPTRRQWVERTVLMVNEALRHIDFPTWEHCHNSPERSISPAQISTIWVGPEGLHMSDAAAELLDFVSW